MTRNFYNILDVPENASKEEIKKQYKKLAVKYHPDKEGGDEEEFKKISEAYEILGDDEKRKKYDMLGDDGWNNSDGGMGMHMNAQDIFSQFFGSMNDGFGGLNMNMHSHHQPEHKTKQKNHHLHIIEISLKDAFTGLQKQIKVTVQKPCLNCNETCYTCQGKGMVTQMHRMGIFTQIVQGVCTECRGNGIRTNAKSSCSNCKGKGHTIEDHNISLKIEPGVQNGHHEKFAGLGEQKITNDDIAGDLIFEIRVREDEMFQRQGNDLHTEVTISLWDSIIGKEVNIPMFDSNIKIKTKELGNGIIQPGKKYIITGKGMPFSRNRGNLIVSFKIDYPTKRLVSDERHRIRDLLQNMKLI